VPVAAVLSATGSDLDPAELIAWTNGHVGAKYQRIVNVMVMDSFPRNIAGKTLKRELRERYKESK
jgi:acyl-CoA synthetase (AMP-forming)/AMP-acid ligase II